MPPKVSPRRFPPPWTIDEREESFIVRDKTGLALVTLFYRRGPHGPLHRPPRS